MRKPQGCTKANLAPSKRVHWLFAGLHSEGIGEARLTLLALTLEPVLCLITHVRDLYDHA